MPTMNVNLTAEMVDFIESEVSTGHYVSASEVVREALRIMRHDREAETVKLHLLRDEIERGYDQSERDEFSSRTVDQIAEAVLDGRLS